MSKEGAVQQLQNVEKHLQKGARKKAVSELKKVLKREPENIRALTRLGDVQAELGEMAAAREAYVRVGEFYRREGYLLKAISMYKALTERFSEDADLLVALGDLFRQMGLYSDAVIRYRAAIELLHRQRRVLEKLGVVERVLDLNPDNVADRVRLAEAYVKIEQLDAARQQLRIAAGELFKRSEFEAFLQVGERYLHFQPDDLETNRRMAEVFAGRKQYLKALEKLQICYDLKPKGRDVLEMIARMFVELGERDKAVYVYKELVHQAESDNLLPEKERYERQIQRLSGHSDQIVVQVGHLRSGQEVEFEEFDDVTVIQESDPMTVGDFAELPIEDELDEAIEAVDEAPHGTTEDPDEVEFDVGEIEETVVADTGFEGFEIGGVNPFDAIRAMREPAAAEPPPLQGVAIPLHEPPPEVALPDSVVSDLREVDFYLQNKMLVEAREILDELLLQHPGEPAIEEKRKVLEALA
jgi:tetratricopeptide (TPR) repeat protein